MNIPLFSIIIPTYNSEKSIEQCLKSIFSQSFDSFQVLIIDGLSTDKTIQIVEAYSQIDKRLSFFSEKDKGVYDAMNKGISKATGEW